MAITPQNTVYQGREGTGQAQIFGREGNPFGAVRARMLDIDRRQAIQAEKDRLMKADRDKKLIEAMNVDPEKTYAPFNQQVLEAANAHRQRVTDYFNNGGDPNNVNFSAWNKKQWNQINDLARRGTYIQDIVRGVEADVDKNPYLKGNKEAIMKKVWDTYLNPDGTAKKFDQINEKEIMNIPNNPEFYDLQKYFDEFASNAKEHTYAWVKRINGALGQEVDDVKLKASPFYTPDQNDPMGVKTKNGVPVINVTDSMIHSFIDGDPIRREAVQIGAAKSGLSVREYVTGMLQNSVRNKGAGIDLDVRPVSKFYPSNYTDTSGIKRNDAPLYQERMKTVGSVLNAFWNSDGTRREEPTQESIAALSQIARNTKVGDGEVLEASYVKGTTDPGMTEKFGKKLKNSPEDRIVFNVKFSDRGSTKLHEIPLNQLQGGAINSLFETSKAQGGKKVNWDAALRMNDESGGAFYSPYADPKFDNNARAQSQANQVTRWKNFEDLESMENRVINGKKISKVEKNPKRWPLGNDELDITYADGSKETIVPTEQFLNDLYKAKLGDQETTSGSTGESGIQWQ